jgi:hypothetical protein
MGLFHDVFEINIEFINQYKLQCELWMFDILLILSDFEFSTEELLATIGSLQMLIE